MKYKILYGVIAGSFCLLAHQSYARIKLITLPVREHVEIQLENQQVTIIEEERIVPLKKGNNDIDFSWQNTYIKPETIVFRVLPEEKPTEKQKERLKTNVLSVSYPPNEDALTWKVSANRNGGARVRITYAINQLGKSYHYIARTNSEENQMDLRQYVKVINRSGEEYQNADLNTGTGKNISLPMGLNESQEFLNQHYNNVLIDKTYTVNASELGYRNRKQDKLNVLMHYHLHNDGQHKLGKHSLAPGKFRIYQHDKQGTTVFVGEDWGKFTAKGNDSKLYIGQARDIVVKRIIERKKRQRISGNLYNIDVLAEDLSEQVSDVEGQQICSAINAYFNQSVQDKSWQLAYFGQHHFYLISSCQIKIKTTPLETNLGQPIARNLFIGIDADYWNQTLNEIQMFLFSMPLNQQRSEQGQTIINSLWVWGGGPYPLPRLSRPDNGSSKAWNRVFSNHKLIQQLCHYTDIEHLLLNDYKHDMVKNKPSEQHQLIVLNDLENAYSQKDFYTWLEVIKNYETQWFAPLLDALNKKNISSLNVITEDSTIFSLNKRQINSWWIRKKPLISLLE